jgi:asparagine synthetase B (glutamine-hydrolysing)
MCGIFASISTQGVTLPNAQVKQLLQRRGPDHVKELSRTLSTDKGDLSLHFLSTVLALRGGHVTPQPFDDPETGSLLCWNGEAWDIDGAAVDGNDGDTIFRLLTSFAAQQVPINAVLDVLRSISGPFAFVFFDECQKLLYFGRDRLGRRSLLLHVDNATGTFQVSSTAGSMEEGWVEVEADGIYVMSLSQSLEHPYLLACTENTNILNGNLYRCPWDTTFSVSRIPVGSTFAVLTLPVGSAYHLSRITEQRTIRCAYTHK